jgi:hypothetical protein
MKLKLKHLTLNGQVSVDLVTGERDSLQAVLDSIYAPKETASGTKKPAAKKPATTTTTTEPVKEETKGGLKGTSDQGSGGLKSKSDQSGGGLKSKKDQ